VSQDFLIFFDRQ